jgi:hypothetical protein|tara:strand:- start:310 stop:720 length:411 start_codon:yes stop_codon:yes gene_type:complete
MCHSEPEEWDDGTEGRGFDRATTIGCARHFAGEFLGQMLHLNAFEGYDHVLAKSDFPTDENWSAAKKKEYAKSFSDIVHALNVVDKKTKKSWSLVPHLHDPNTRVVETVVDEIGVFAVSIPGAGIVTKGRGKRKKY